MTWLVMDRFNGGVGVWGGGLGCGNDDGYWGFRVEGMKASRARSTLGAFDVNVDAWRSVAVRQRFLEDDVTSTGFGRSKL